MGRQQAYQANAPSIVQTQHGMEQQRTWNHGQWSWLMGQELSWTLVFSGLGTGWKLWELFQAGVSSKEVFKLSCSEGARLTGFVAFSVHCHSCSQHSVLPMAAAWDPHGSHAAKGRTEKGKEDTTGQKITPPWSSYHCSSHHGSVLCSPCKQGVVLHSALDGPCRAHL